MSDPYRQPSPPPPEPKRKPSALDWLARFVPQEMTGNVLDRVAEQYGMERNRTHLRTETDQELKARILQHLDAGLRGRTAVGEKE